MLKKKEEQRRPPWEQEAGGSNPLAPTISFVENSKGYRFAPVTFFVCVV